MSARTAITAAAVPEPRSAGTATRRAPRPALLALGLALLTVVAFLPALDCGFVDFDDNQYVYENREVRLGLTPATARWAATAVVAGAWNPLTVLSHMADVELYGLDPHGHHLTSVLLHCANVLMLFGFLYAATGRPWRSAAVAALFAVHPLRVESVVWIAERKDVLSAFFWLATMLAWLRWVRRPGAGRYALVAAFLALGLTAKAMLVTLPAALLLLDWWPLGRLRPEGTEGGGGVPWRRLAALALEKIPLLALSATAAAVTLVTQSRTLQPLAAMPPLERLGRAATSYAAYLGDTLLPRNLAFFYPLREVSAGEALAAALLLTATTALAVRRARRAPWLLFGWLWFLGVLLPVSGIAQIGAHERADRYTYLPSIGLLVAIVWGIAELTARRPRLRAAAAGAAAAAVLVLAVATRAQIATWSDSETLFRHAAAVTEDNYLAHLNLGVLLARRGEREEAAGHFQAALAAAPDNPEVLGGAADALVAWGRPRAALPHLARALEIAPDDPRLHHTAAVAFEELGDDRRAIEHLRRAVELDPGFAAAQHGLGELLLRHGDGDGALAAFRAALAADPGRLALYEPVARLLAERGRDEEAAAYREAGARMRALAGAGEPGRATIPPRSAP